MPSSTNNTKESLQRLIIITTSIIVVLGITLCIGGFYTAVYGTSGLNQKNTACLVHSKFISVDSCKSSISKYGVTREKCYCAKWVVSHEDVNTINATIKDIHIYKLESDAINRAAMYNVCLTNKQRIHLKKKENQ